MATINSTNSNMAIGAKSEVTRPVQPSFLVDINGNPSNVTGDGTNWTVTFDREIYDIGGNFNTTTHTFTAPVSGYYLFSYTIFEYGYSSSNSDGNYILNTSSGTYGGIFGPYNSSPTYMISVHDTVFCYLTAGDEAYVSLIVNGSASKNIDILGSETTTRFSGYLVC